MKAEENLCDEALFERYQEGFLPAFEVLFSRYRDKLLRFIQTRVRDRQSAEDVFQETFIRIFRDLRHIQLKARFSTLLYTIARNLSLNRIRDEKRLGRIIQEEKREERADPNAGPPAAAERSEAFEIVKEAVDRLDPDHREVFVLRYELGLGYGSIAAILGIPSGTVKSRVFYAIQSVRKRVMQKYNAWRIHEE